MAVTHSAWLVWTPDGLPSAFGTESGAGLAAVADTQFVVIVAAEEESQLVDHLSDIEGLEN